VNMKRSIWLFGGMLLNAAVAFAADPEQRALPDFEVVSATGTAAPAAGLTTEARWLLAYVKPGSRPCDQLMNALEHWKIHGLWERTVLVVGADLEGARAYVQSRLPKRAEEATWFADTEESAWKALNLKGVPVLLAVQDGRIAWTLSGVLNDPEALESVVRSWVEAGPR
jgi:hypothetical protein